MANGGQSSGDAEVRDSSQQLLGTDADAQDDSLTGGDAGSVEGQAKRGRQPAWRAEFEALRAQNERLQADLRAAQGQAHRAESIAMSVAQGAAQRQQQPSEDIDTDDPEALKRHLTTQSAKIRELEAREARREAEAMERSQREAWYVYLKDDLAEPLEVDFASVQAQLNAIPVDELAKRGAALITRAAKAKAKPAEADIAAAKKAAGDAVAKRLGVYSDEGPINGGGGGGETLEAMQAKFKNNPEGLKNYGPFQKWAGVT